MLYVKLHVMLHVKLHVTCDVTCYVWRFMLYVKLHVIWDVFFHCVRFVTRDRDALLLYNGRFNHRHDFIALEIVSEQVQLSFSAGKTLLRLRHSSDCLLGMKQLFCPLQVKTGPLWRRLWRAESVMESGTQFTCTTTIRCVLILQHAVFCISLSTESNQQLLQKLLSWAPDLKQCVDI